MQKKWLVKCAKRQASHLAVYIAVWKQKKRTIMSKKQIIKIIVSVLIAALTALGAAIGLNSCNVVRTITNRSEYYQRGDTSVMIQTKTTESYDASKKLMY